MYNKTLNLTFIKSTLCNYNKIKKKTYPKKTMFDTIKFYIHIKL